MGGLENDIETNFVFQKRFRCLPAEAFEGDHAVLLVAAPAPELVAAPADLRCFICSSNESFAVETCFTRPVRRGDAAAAAAAAPPPPSPLLPTLPKIPSLSLSLSPSSSLLRLDLLPERRDAFLFTEGEEEVEDDCEEDLLLNRFVFRNTISTELSESEAATPASPLLPPPCSPSSSSDELSITRERFFGIPRINYSFSKTFRLSRARF